MLLIVLGSLAAMSLAMLVLIAMCRAGVHFDRTLEQVAVDAGDMGRALEVRERIARRPARRERAQSTAALRRRHLAAVLAADARR